MEMKSIMIKNLIMIIIGCIIVTYFVYFRLIFIRLPKELINQSDFHTILYTLAATISLTLFFYTVYKLYKIHYITWYKPPTNILILWLSNQISTLFKVYYNSLKAFDDFIKHTILVEHLGQILKSLSVIFIKIFTKVKSKKYIIIYTMLDLMPKIIFLIAFSFDVYNHKFYYSYQLVGILFIPLLYKYILFTLREFSEHNIKDMNESILIYYFHSGQIMTSEDIIDNCKGIINPKDTYYNPKQRFSLHVVDLSESYKQECFDNGRQLTDDLMFYSKQMNFFQRIRGNVARLEIQNKYTIYFNLIRYTIYSILWLYILVYLDIISLDSVTFLENIQDSSEPFS